MSDCPLCIAIEREIWIGCTEGFVILATKNKKGHAKRCQIVYKLHESQVRQAVHDSAVKILFEFISENHRDHDWTIMEPTHASIPEHFHLVASTIDDETATDTDLIADTDRIEIRFKRRKIK